MKTYLMVVVGHRRSESPLSESHIMTVCPPLERDRDKNNLKLSGFKGVVEHFFPIPLTNMNQSKTRETQTEPRFFGNKRKKRNRLRWVQYRETVVVPALELCSGGCWVILSFTQALVSVSKSGGTVSMSDKQQMARIGTNQLPQPQTTSR